MGRPKGATKGGKLKDIVKQIPQGSKSGKKTIFDDDEDDELDNIPGDVDDIFAAKKAAKQAAKNDTIIPSKGKVVKKTTRSSKRNLDEIDSNEEEDSDNNNGDLDEDNSEQDNGNEDGDDGLDDYEDDDNFGVNDEDIEGMGNFMNEYDEDEDADDEGLEEYNDDEDDEDSPEVVKGDTDEVLAMKQWHEQLVASTGNKNLKKQKKDNKIDIAKSSSTKIISDEDEIDADLLNALDEFDDNNAYSEEDSEEENENNNDDEEDINELENILNSKNKIDKNSNRTKSIGNIEVTVLDSSSELDPLSMFKMSKSAIDFTKSISDKQQRVRYSSFTGAKKAGPSKKFRSR
jgi:hypothetical protein